MAIKVRWWNIAKPISIAEERAGRAIAGALEHVLGVANERVPIDEGTLQRSGDTDVDVRQGIGAISYDTPYAVRLHENPQYNFQFGREGKWLENAINAEAAAVKAYLASDMAGMF